MDLPFAARLRYPLSVGEDNIHLPSRELVEYFPVSYIQIDCIEMDLYCTEGRETVPVSDVENIH
jgi:hypothetical protein